MSEYHYLGYRTTVGENLRYLISDRNGRSLACLLFGAAAWKCADRDAFIGWDVYLLALNPNFKKELRAPACSRTEGRVGRC